MMTDDLTGVVVVVVVVVVIGREGGSSVSLGSSRIRGSLGSVSSAELGSPSLDSMSAESSPMHRSATCEKPGDEAGSSREELNMDDDKDKSKEKQKSEDDLVSAGRSDKRNGYESIDSINLQPP